MGLAGLEPVQVPAAEARDGGGVGLVQEVEVHVAVFLDPPVPDIADVFAGPGWQRHREKSGGDEGSDDALHGLVSFRFSR